MSKTKKPVIAIDGTAGSGKGTLAKKLASYLGFDHLDSGILYRMFAYEFINQKGDLEQLEKIKINYSILSNKKKLSTINFFLFLAIFFNLSKNFDRIVDKKFINDPIEIISNKITAQKQNNLDDFIYYTGWYGEAPISYKILENKMYEKKFIFNVISNK